MRIETVGEPPADIAIIGGIHGNEPCGIAAVDRLANEGVDSEKTVKLIVANEQAAAADQRYLDADLNSVFPGDATAASHEHRLAARLLDEVTECDAILSLHSSHSTTEPFLGYANLTPTLVDFLFALTVPKAVDMARIPRTTLSKVTPTLIAECGTPQTTEAACTAYQIATQFIKAANNDPVTALYSDVMCYQLDGSVIPKDPVEEYTILAENFAPVHKGEVFATTAGGTQLVADDDFYPALMSAEGYHSKLGYRADRVGWLSHQPEAGGSATE